ncbi:efflux RND transporter periplasmic adaptor subunit [Tranquillimonas rosea]|uniref:efflux RND transporter periplasmic adaptor subunit n=1 Tax=Tranquillimonas rosea TaxID=641238 RepID=UPI003BA9788A
MQFLRRTLVGVFLMATTVGLLALAAATVWSALQTRLADTPARPPAEEPVVSVDVIEVTPETIAPVLETFGEVQSRRTLEVRASASGRVIGVGENIDAGARVTRGDLLFRIDPTEAERARDIARTDVADAEAELRDARRAVDIARDDLASGRAQAELRRQALARQRDLSDRGVGTAADLETAELNAAAADQAVLSRRQALADAEARVDQATTALERQRIALDEAKRALDDTEVVAPFDGILSEVVVSEGGLVSANERMADLIDGEALEVAFRVSTPQYARLVDEAGSLIDAPVTVSLEVNDYVLSTTGVITRESALVAEGETGRVLYARLDSAAGFRAGDFATVRVTEPELGGVARLPASAVDSAGQVLIVGPEQRLAVVRAPVLRRQDDDVIVAADAIAGELVVARQTPLLGTGIKVDPDMRRGPADSGPGDTEEMVALSAERRARLVAFVEDDAVMPPQAKTRVLAQLRAPEVPATMVARIEAQIEG